MNDMRYDVAVVGAGQAGLAIGHALAVQRKRFVILEFPTMELARAWWASPEYAEAKALRQSIATTRMVLTEGLPAGVPLPV